MVLRVVAIHHIFAREKWYTPLTPFLATKHSGQIRDPLCNQLWVRQGTPQENAARWKRKKKKKNKKEEGKRNIKTREIRRKKKGEEEWWEEKTKDLTQSFFIFVFETLPSFDIVSFVLILILFFEGLTVPLLFVPLILSHPLCFDP